MNGIDYDTPTRAARFTIVVCGAVLFFGLMFHLQQQHERFCSFHSDDRSCQAQVPSPAME